MMNLLIRFKGGPGSGHRGHSGRPGKGATVSVSEEQADDMWIDNYYSNLIKGVSQGQRISDTETYGATDNDWSDEEVIQAAMLLQKRAESTQLSTKTVYRGDTRFSEEEALEEFKKGATIELSGLSAASKSEDIAWTYADVEVIGGEGIGIIYHLHNPNGIIGTEILSADQELLLPHGAKYTVTRLHVEDEEGWDRILHVYMQSNDRL